MAAAPFLLAPFLLFAQLTEASFPPCALQAAPDAITLSNGFVSLVVDTARPAVTSLKADFLGGANFQAEVLAPGGLRLESVLNDGSVLSSADANNSGAKLRIITNTSELAAISISGIVDSVAAPMATETWTFALHREARVFDFNATGRLLFSEAGAVQVRRSMYLNAESIYAFFARGVVQMKAADAKASHFGATDMLPRLYALGGGTAVDVIRGGGGAGHGVTLLSSGKGAYMSGWHEVLDGSLPRLDVWSDGTLARDGRSATSGTWQTSATIAPNDRNVR